jgi:hypothetical protein
MCRRAQTGSRRSERLLLMEAFAHRRRHDKTRRRPTIGAGNGVWARVDTGWRSARMYSVELWTGTSFGNFVARAILSLFAPIG